MFQHDSAWTNFDIISYVLHITLLDTTQSSRLLIVYSRQCCGGKTKNSDSPVARDFSLLEILQTRSPVLWESSFFFIFFFYWGFKGKGCEVDH